MISTIKAFLIKIPIVLDTYNKFQNRIRAIFNRNKSLLYDKKGVEIGGPSKVFSKSGPFPIYPLVKSVDNINFSDNNFWSSIEEGYNFKFDDNKDAGKQIIADGIDLSKIKDSSYDFMLSSHVLEHIANPLKALYEWRRILKENGHLVIILPNMHNTYDRKRPLTTLSHIVDDYRNSTTEDDKTHLQEVIDLHDLTNDSTVSSYEAHVTRTLNNFQTRIVHHHTFRMSLVLELLDYSKFQIIDFQSFSPYHLLAIARKFGDNQAVDNRVMLNKAKNH
jgi:SAM-dependent methyltransferase